MPKTADEDTSIDPVSADSGREVTIHAPEADDDAPETGGKEPKPSRASGFRRLSEDFYGFRDSFAKTLEERMGSLRESIREELRQARSEGQPARAADKEPEAQQLDNDLKGLNDRLKEIYKESAAAGLTPAQQQRLMQEFNETAARRDETKEKILRRSILEDVRKERPAESRQDNPVLTMLQNEFDDIMSTSSNEERTKRLNMIEADAQYHHHVEGRPKNMALFRESATRVRAKLGLGRSTPPERDRAALGTATGNRGGSSQPGIRINEALVRSAQNSVPGLTPEKLAKYLED